MEQIFDPESVRGSETAGQAIQAAIRCGRQRGRKKKTICLSKAGTYLTSSVFKEPYGISDGGRSCAFRQLRGGAVSDYEKPRPE